MTMLSSLHLYPKTPRDLVVKTKTGGLISLVALAVMGFLFFTELTAYLYSRFETTLSLDDNNDQKLLIDFQLELPKMPCHVVGVEVSDVFGTHKVNSASNVFKHKLDADGKRGELVGGSVSSTAAGEQMAQSGRANFLLETPPVRDESDFEQSPLAPADFDAAVESFDLVLVDFFAPWCPHCIRFAPVWAEAGKLLDESDVSERVVLAKLDCNEHQKYCVERHSIDHYPTIRAYANGGNEMVNYEGNMGEASAIVAYVKQVLSTRQQAADEATQSGAAQLSFAVNESVQVWFHNGWRDAKVTSKVSAAELATLEEGQQAREYKVRFTSFAAPEGSPRRGHGMLVMFGGFIQMVDNGEGEDGEPDHNEHEVSVHIMRTKPVHKAAYHLSERVQLRVPAGWVAALVVDTRPLADSDANCTRREAAGECRTDPKHMLVQCMKSCHASSHPSEYKVRTELSTRWVTHERLLPENAVLHVVTHAESHEGCELSGALMVSRVPGSVVLRVDPHAHGFNVKAANLSHAVRHLSFGYSDHRRNVNVGGALPSSLIHARTPLDGAAFASDHSHESHMHYLKVIRTTITLLAHSEAIDMYHFTAASSTMTHHGSPAISFSYDLSPMQILIAEETEGLFRFVVYCFAILGGGFTVFGLVDGVLFHGGRMLREKVGLGKQG